MCTIAKPTYADLEKCRKRYVEYWAECNNCNNYIRSNFDHLTLIELYYLAKNVEILEEFKLNIVIHLSEMMDYLKNGTSYIDHHCICK